MVQKKSHWNSERVNSLSFYLWRCDVQAKWDGASTMRSQTLLISTEYDVSQAKEKLVWHFYRFRANSRIKSEAKIGKLLEEDL